MYISRRRFDPQWVRAAEEPSFEQTEWLDAAGDDSPSGRLRCARRGAAPGSAAHAAVGGRGGQARGDALAQEAEAEPKEPEDEKDKKKYEPLTGQASAGFSFTQGTATRGPSTWPWP